MPKLKKDTIIPTAEEDAAITAGISADMDSRELDEDWFAGPTDTRKVPGRHPDEHPLRG